MKWVGLTGGLGTGKTTVSLILARLGIPVLDADRIAREVSEPNGPAYPGIVQAFGPTVVQSDKRLDRAALARAVFGFPEKLALLEKLIHPFVQAEVLRQKQWLEDQGTLWAVYDVPLLFEKNLHEQFDYIVVVAVGDEKIQIQRLKDRNAWNDEEIRKRLKAQKPLGEKIAQADFVIQNDATLSELEKKVAALVQMLNDLWKET